MERFSSNSAPSRETAMERAKKYEWMPLGVDRLPSRMPRSHHAHACQSGRRIVDLTPGKSRYRTFGIRWFPLVRFMR